jgi:diaminohydroxyphosphoribosylaminopyrimidine deaminase/5-amino-6-(5-phosphoribosylamino)uracil reductase
MQVSVESHSQNQPDDARSQQDRRFMRIALALAERGLGQTAPNPAVGALLVDPVSGEVIARGWTQAGGRPHAETIALAHAGERARGATLYVTLEPCSHHGVTAPCAEAVVAAGVGRVVAGIEDPDPRVAGRGLRRLREAGIAVTTGVMAGEANWMVRGHILRVIERRPFTQVKLALGPDGKVPRGQGGRPTWVTGEQSRARGHLLRAMSDAILVGSRTVAEDDPELTCRLPGLASRSPLRIVLASRLEVRPDSRLVRTARQVPVLVFCGPGADPRRRGELERAGCAVVSVREVGGTLWLPAIVEELAARGVTRLLVEGGPAVWRSFARAGFVDEAVIFHAAAAHAGSVDADRLLGAYLPDMGMSLVARRTVGDDAMLVLRRQASGSRANHSASL